MQWSSSSECDERQLARVDTAFDRHRAQRLLHAGIDHGHDALGLNAGTIECVACGVDVERAESGERAPRGNASEHEIRIGHRGLPTAAAVAGRSGHRTCAPRPDEQRAAGIEACDRSATRADGVHVERRQAQWEATDDASRCRLGQGATHETHVGRRAAHVEGDGIGRFVGGGDCCRREHSAGRA